MTNSRLAPIYAVESLTSLAGSIVGFFIPIYLLTLGYDIRDVMWYTLVQAVAGLPLALATGWLSAKFQLKYLMAARVPILIAVLVLLINFPNHPVPLELIGVLQAAHFALYWIPLHVFFTMATSRDKIGRQFGLLSALPKFVSVAGPVTAGLVAATLGFNWIFAAAAVLYAASSIPMLAIPPYQESLDFGWTKFRQLYRRYRRYFWLEVAENIQEELDGVIWPLVVFLTLNNTLQAGLVGTIIAAGSAIFTYIMGHISDRRDPFVLIRLGASLCLVLWLVRLGTITPVMAYVVSAIMGFASVIQTIPFNGIIYNLARDNNPREFILFREVPITIARTLVYGTGLIVATHVQLLFWLAIAAYAVFAVMPRFKITEA